MRITAKFLVVRLDGEVIEISPVQDQYTDVTLKVYSEYLTDEDFYQYFGHFNHASLEKFRENGSLATTQEAKDLVASLSRLSINIESKEVEIV